jgi:hypothetical protein
MAAWARDTSQPWTRLDFDQFGLHAALDVKTIQALYYIESQESNARSASHGVDCLE